MIEVDIRPWSDNDLPLLERLMGDPVMTEHLGGPETQDAIRRRHDRYRVSSASGTGPMFAIVVGPDRVAAGSIGYWERVWRGWKVWECGWSVLPEMQRQGVATRATMAVVERARGAGKHRYIHAFPGVENVASNSVCRKAGFTLQGGAAVEYPPGHIMQCNDWCLDLIARMV